jgi:hypothetical protein
MLIDLALDVAGAAFGARLLRADGVAGIRFEDVVGFGEAFIRKVH